MDQRIPQDEQTLGSSTDIQIDQDYSKDQKICDGKFTWRCLKRKGKVLMAKTMQLRIIYFVLVLLFGGGAGAIATFGYYQNKLQNRQIVNDIVYPRWDHQHDTMNQNNFGRWEAVIPDRSVSASRGDSIGMQTVHSAILPNGMVILASGSSWRNNKDKTQTFPEYKDPKNFVGLYDQQTFNITQRILKNPNLTKEEILYQYWSLNNNVGIYNPFDNSFFRIPHPIQEVDKQGKFFVPNDFFCVGHIQLPNGDVLFTGGTEYYTPYRSGHKQTYIFDWKKAENIHWARDVMDWSYNQSWTQLKELRKSKSDLYPWVHSGQMNQGRWYPNIVPLVDGKLVVFSGFLGNFSKTGSKQAYQYQMNKDIQIFDYWAYANTTNKEASSSYWSHFSIADVEGSPFDIRLEGELPPAANCSECTKDPDDTVAYEICRRRCQDYQYDSFKLYPQNYLVSPDQIFITQEGDWNSLRETRDCCIRMTKRTFYMKINKNGNGKTQSLSFESHEKSNRHENVSMSGTSTQYLYKYPNGTQKVKIQVYGGMHMMTGGTLLPGVIATDLQNISSYSAGSKVQYAGSRGSRKYENFDIDQKTWSKIQQTFMGATYEQDRTMHYSILLPNKQILIVNGGAYDFYNPSESPILLRPFFNKTSQDIQFRRQVMAPARCPRLYHNIAMLMDDGRVLTSGGNAARAIVDLQEPLINIQEEQKKKQQSNQTIGQYRYNEKKVDTHVFLHTDGSTGKGHSDSQAEQWRMQIFSPPYLFIDPMRKLTVKLMKAQDSLKNGHKEYHLIKSNQEYQLEVQGAPGMPQSQNCRKIYESETEQNLERESIVIIKLSSPTHGWDSGQRLYDLKITNHQRLQGKKLKITFETPDAKEKLIAPGFYWMFYVDCNGKVAKSIPVRFDDIATTVFA